jgi:HprK-related kinase A
MLKPLALKNESIDVIRAFGRDAVIGPSFPGTRKGTVAHLAPDESSVDARHVPARPALIVFPQYTRGAELVVHPVPKSRAFARLAANSFNYELIGPDGFEAVGDLIEACECYRLQYSRLDEAIETMDELIEIVSEPLPPVSEVPATH